MWILLTILPQYGILEKLVTFLVNKNSKVIFRGNFLFLDKFFRSEWTIFSWKFHNSGALCQVFRMKLSTVLFKLKIFVCFQKFQWIKDFSLNFPICKFKNYISYSVDPGSPGLKWPVLYLAPHSWAQALSWTILKYKINTTHQWLNGNH